MKKNILQHVGEDADNGGSSDRRRSDCSLCGWSMAGLSSGMNVNEIMSPVSYEESQKAEHYVRRELQDSWVNSALKLRFCKEMLIMVI